MNCVKHKTIMERKDKKGRWYHWVEGMDKVMCYGLYQVDLNQLNREPIAPTTDEISEQITAEEAEEMFNPQENTMKVKEEPKPVDTSPMTKQDWRDKEDRENERWDLKQQRDIRCNLGVARLREMFVSEGGNIQDSEMDRTYHWIWTGEWPD